MIGGAGAAAWANLAVQAEKKACTVDEDTTLPSSEPPEHHVAQQQQQAKLDGEG